ncbi:hemocytin-like [Melitaea cinxia]|uniref:hemocytin-like n=1 Tax=Melitaea cinxia TaxID=113334 RepID=UPI001E27020D|nr:hemocytin-like [Melitaea cinxia]
MNLITNVFILLFGIYVCEAAYGTPSVEQYGQADVQAPPYVPSYMKNPSFTKNQPSHYGRKTYTKTGGTKTGYAGTKTSYAGTKSGFSYAGTKNGFGVSRSWLPSAGIPSYGDFSINANQPYTNLCDIECKNNGICIAKNTCSCPPNFQGKYCEFEKKACLAFPPLPMNSKRKCSSELCTITCLEGHKFIDGSTIANMKCVGGQWRPTRADLTSIPDCQPECDPPCLNGGVCLSVNTCQCPADYRGPQCQYSASACEVRKLAFNGGYNCNGNSEKFSCKLSCPIGASFSTPAAERYTCYYSTGVFEPQPIPHCVFEDVIVITPSNYHKIPTLSHVKSPNTTETTPYELTTHGAGKYGHSKKPINIVIQDFTPKGGSCLTWAGVHYKTFDGKIYSFQSPCKHILVRDAVDHKYTIAIRHPECERHIYCPSEIIIYLEDKMYALSIAEDGSVVFRNSKRMIPIPAFLPGIRVSMPSDHVVVNLDVGVTLKWDTNDLVFIEGSVLLWNKTEGLCGTLDGNPENEMMTKEGNVAHTKSVMIASWELNKIGDICDSSPTEVSACSSKSNADMKEALKFCTKIFSKDKFRKCSTVMDVSQLLEVCQWDYCACTSSLSPEECACKTVSVYAKECLRHGVQEMKAWRDSETCPMKCPEGKIYKACGSDTQPSCALSEVTSKDNSTCVEGCFCPEGLLLESGRCIPKNECPCRVRNQNFPPGTVMPKDCNTCTCQSGEWTCTKVPCGARCGAVGDPHYTTFDGLRYNFMGHCSYTLMKTDNITIDVENVACSGAITEAMNLVPYKGEGKPSCTKAVNLAYNGANIHLKQGGFILVNGKEVNSLPVSIGDIKIRAASSLFIIIHLPMKVDLWWDGSTRVFVDVPPSFHEQTKGLCGTFNLNQKDDFLTPEGDVEQSALAFANKWKTREFCDDVAVKEPENPCKVNVQNKDSAEKYCSQLKSKLFESCHWYVDVQPFYENCVYDMCACADDVSRCLCPVLGDYATACARAGVHVQWRYNVKECGECAALSHLYTCVACSMNELNPAAAGAELQCGGGQQYTVCADSCLRTCADVALAGGACRPACVEGCACAAGQVLDNNNVCVPVALCPCYHKGMEFKPGYKEVRAGKRERELCTCVGARWDCAPASPEQIQNYPPAEDVRSSCSAAANLEFTTCETKEPLTCKNMHLPQTAVSQECRPGCQCKKGYVLDASAKKCVVPTDCPCHHGGRSYPDGHTMQEECNTCECKSGNWTCTDRKCAGVCGAWGDSHVTTFDGQSYDFEGVCTYLLAKGSTDGKDGFCVEIQVSLLSFDRVCSFNEPCGTTGATCSKSVTLRVGGGGPDEEVVSLTKNAPLPDTSKLKRIKLRTAGAYVFLDVQSLALSLQWDKAMRVYVKLDTMWRNRVKGLCGNYNSDMRDDFQTPSGGGFAETSPLLFADSWKLKPTCPKPVEVTDHCKERPHRKGWASSMCGVMKRAPFAACHAEVPADAFVARCEADACACDAGDDCGCACAALAAYAHACAARGVTFKWRTQDLCPMQCDEECSNYNECISPCPPETCDNTLDYAEIKSACEKDTCVEGCKPNKTCPEGTIYSNSSLKECVPRAKCKPVCMTLEDGREILEGEVIEQDACHTCRCSKKEKICTGQPCATETTTIGLTAPPETTPHDQPLTCKTGWTEWINRGPPEISSSGQSIDNEPLPKTNELTVGSPMCTTDKMTKIECRTVKDHKMPKETGLNVECSLEKGLICLEAEKNCPDFEIRVYCECEDVFQCLNSTHPNNPHPTDCTKFYECTPDVTNPIEKHAVLKSCGPGLFYNPKLMICDWPTSVVAIRPECMTKQETTTRPCPPGQVFKDCAFPCDKLCDHFKNTVRSWDKCKPGEKCASGCVDEEVANIKCEFGSMWRDSKTCVPLKDCTCDNNGEIIKPGGVVTDNCQKCQCLDNALHCDSSECVSIKTPVKGSTHSPIMLPPTTSTSTTTTTTTSTTPAPTTTSTTPTPTTTTTTTTTTPIPTTITTIFVTNATIPEATTTIRYVDTTILVKNTATPPPECSPERYKNLMWEGTPLPDIAFSASSVANSQFEPMFAKLNGSATAVSAGSWSPDQNDRNPYIQVELPQIEPIYGVILQGSPLFDQYVSSYDIMYGDDGLVFSTVDGPDGKPKIFRGPVDNKTPVKQMIKPPIEAKYVRIRPISWHDNVAVRLELIGCEELTTTVLFIFISILLALAESFLNCTEPLGLGANLPAHMITASSNNDAVTNLKLDGKSGWKPLYSTPGEWIMFDFTSPRNLTGIKTKGGPSGFVTAYNIMYTSNLTTFNPLLDENGATRLILANFDSNTAVLNEFRPPIRAQYLKVLPVKWEENIEMRVEPIGCFEPYLATNGINNFISIMVLPAVEEEVREEQARERQTMLGMDGDKGEGKTLKHPHNTLRTEEVPESCPMCPGVPHAECFCATGLHYDGENCVPRDQCPCVVGFITYPVGSTYRGDDCDECVCKLGGVADCKPAKKCECASDLVPILKPSCECVCEPCTNGTKICPTSKLCLPLEKWCDGILDCPDDELDCTTVAPVTETVITTVVQTEAATPPPITTLAPTTTTEKPIECPIVQCPPGYFVRQISATHSSYKTPTELPPPRPRYSYQRYYKGSKGGGFAKGGYSKTSFSKGGYAPPPRPSRNQAFTLDKPTITTTPDKKQCVEFKCIPELPPIPPKGSTAAPVVCSTPACPPRYSLKLDSVPDDLNKCPQYICVPPPERPVFCNMTGRTFSTFDGSEYKYDICFNILARENRIGEWAVLIRKKCQKIGCQNQLLLLQDKEVLLVKPNMMMEYNDYEYTVEQTSKICFQKNSFDVSRLGDGISIKSRKYNFTVLYSPDGDVKIGVSKKYLGHVDGLCGLFDGDASNDRTMPNGKIATNLEQFGRSWSKPGPLPTDCQVDAAPKEQQKRVWGLCAVITYGNIHFFCTLQLEEPLWCNGASCRLKHRREEPIAQCSKVLNLDKWRSICLEKIIKCADLVINGTKRTEEECRCLLVEKLVAECLAADKNIDVSTWRMKMNCPAECPAPLVHYDCYRRRCEPSCGGTAVCPVEDGQCLPGCYCPEGKLRKGDQCVTPSDCLDCKYRLLPRTELPCSSVAKEGGVKRHHAPGSIHKRAPNGSQNKKLLNILCTCTGVGAPAKYVTFEGDDLPFLGNCTYLASRNANETGQHKYQVYATNGPCEDISSAVCIKTVHLIHEKNIIHVNKDLTTGKLLTTVNGKTLYKYPITMDWVTISQSNGQDVTVLLPDQHVELVVLQSKMEFSVRVPSFLYSNRTQGLCGVCAGYQDQLITSNGTVTDDFDQMADLQGALRERIWSTIALLQTFKQPLGCLVGTYTVVSSYNLQGKSCGGLHGYNNVQCLPTKARNLQGRFRGFLHGYKCAILVTYIYKFLIIMIGLIGMIDIVASPIIQSPENKEEQLEENVLEILGVAPQTEYGKSWQASPETLTTLEVPPQEQCEELPPPEECVLPPPESNPCYNINDVAKFGACHALVEPGAFVAQCEAELCALNASDACGALQRYAAECRRQGVCLDWRAGLCPLRCEAPLVYRPCVDCERTCDNHDELELNPKKCDKQPVEGCFCPEGKVRVNNTCIEPTKCFPCDAKKEHYAGDEWKEDACTKCTCNKLSAESSAHVSCTTQTCSVPVCSELENLISKPLRPGECCREYMCVEKPPSERCVEPKKMECGFGQVLKQKTKADGCKEFACECKPASECEKIPDDSEVEMLEPGMERLIDDSGCCPRAELVCVPQNCPKPPTCEKFHTLETKNISGQCCPEYKCELPKDKCVVTLEWEAAAKGGEKARTTPQVVLKDTDSVWLDGPCRSCRCESSPVGAVSQCSVTECPAVVSTEQFVLEPRPVPFACCPAAVQVACRDGDSIYKVGENWTSPVNPCESYKCSEIEDGELEKITTVQNCNEDCQPGWEYFPAPADSKQCCGQCKPVACIVDGIKRDIGASWTSPDFCTNYTCANINGTLQVQSKNESCPEISDAIKKQFVLSEEKIPGKCCLKQEPVACRVGNKIYQEGQTWQSSDPCKNYTCLRDEAGLSHSASVETCVKDCKRGWKYVEPAAGLCCGHCIQDKCIVADELKDLGSTWYSADNCTTFTCEGVEGEVFTTSAQFPCPDVSACAPEDLVNETCCQVCREKPSALATCVPKPISKLDSVGLIRVHIGPHGLCVNNEPLEGFQECKGTCDSGTLYNNQTGSHDSSCECCQATRYSSLLVTLTCTDGSVQQHRVASTAECSCKRCGELPTNWYPSKTGHSNPYNRPTPPYGRGGRKEPDEYTIDSMFVRYGTPPTPRQY